MEYEQHFISGFVKQARFAGLTAQQTQELTKKAFPGPSVELATFGAPSLAGFLLGRLREKNRTMDLQHESGDEATFKAKLLERIHEDTPSLPGGIAKFLLVPGFTGYRLGKGSGRESALKSIMLENERSNARAFENSSSPSSINK